MTTRKPLTVRRARAAASVAVVAASLFAKSAEADDRVGISVDWGKLAEVLRVGGPMLAGESLLPVRERVASTPESRWFGASPHLSLVARDWSGAQVLFGHLCLTDQVRLSRSSRMILSRVRLAQGRIAPFAQAGLGQWRVDTDLMPVLPRDVALAGQIGGGFELAIGPSVTVALEADYTVLYREQHEPQMISGPHLWGTFFAARAQF
jgi:hypothetical protein